MSQQKWEDTRKRWAENGVGMSEDPDERPDLKKILLWTDIGKQPKKAIRSQNTMARQRSQKDYEIRHFDKPGKKYSLAPQYPIKQKFSSPIVNTVQPGFLEPFHHLEESNFISPLHDLSYNPMIKLEPVEAEPNADNFPIFDENMVPGVEMEVTVSTDTSSFMNNSLESHEHSFVANRTSDKYNMFIQQFPIPDYLWDYDIDSYLFDPTSNEPAPQSKMRLTSCYVFYKDHCMKWGHVNHWRHHGAARKLEWERAHRDFMILQLEQIKAGLVTVNAYMRQVKQEMVDEWV